MKRWVAATAAALTLAGTVPSAARAQEEGKRYDPDRLVEVLESYLAARRNGNTEKAASYLAEDSRLWFGKREGEGKKRDPAGGGPWATWDDEMKAESRSLGDYHIVMHSIAVTMEEINDYYRLLERGPQRYRATYFFDQDDRIAGTLIESIEGGRNMGRWDAFEAWADENRGGELAALMPEGDIVPSRENAKRWRRLLTEWRRAAGLPRIDAEAGEDEGEP